MNRNLTLHQTLVELSITCSVYGKWPTLDNAGTAHLPTESPAEAKPSGFTIVADGASLELHDGRNITSTRYLPKFVAAATLCSFAARRDARAAVLHASHTHHQPPRCPVQRRRRTCSFVDVSCAYVCEERVAQHNESYAESHGPLPSTDTEQ